MSWVDKMRLQDIPPVLGQLDVEEMWRHASSHGPAPSTSRSTEVMHVSVYDMTTWFVVLADLAHVFLGTNDLRRPEPRLWPLQNDHVTDRLARVTLRGFSSSLPFLLPHVGRGCWNSSFSDSYGVWFLKHFPFSRPCFSLLNRCRVALTSYVR